MCYQLRWTTKGLVSHSQIGWDELYSTNCKYWVSHKSRSWLLLAPTTCYQLDTNNPAATDTKMKHFQSDELECRIYLPSYLTCSRRGICQMFYTSEISKIVNVTPKITILANKWEWRMFLSSVLYRLSVFVQLWRNRRGEICPCRHCQRQCKQDPG